MAKNKMGLGTEMSLQPVKVRDDQIKARDSIYSSVKATLLS